MTKTDWTAEEVRATVEKLSADVPRFNTEDERLCAVAMLTAFAERIAADEIAVPVAEVGNCYWINWIGSGPIAPIVKQHNIKIGDKLFTHPPAHPAQEQPGWKWVPVEPTEAMININPDMLHPRIAATIYKAMLAASPTPPKEK